MPVTALTPEPPRDCSLCPRLVDFRHQSQEKNPDWFNAPAPSFGDASARLLIVGLAPGLRGANRTGRPFTGDYAGDLLYSTLLKFGWATGVYEASPDDSLLLKDCMITNAVRCVPPENKPTGAETKTCRSFLIDRIRALPHLSQILCLGRVSHEATLSALGAKRSAYPFGHAACANIEFYGRTLSVYDSYHCSRYNTNTGRLTEEMFHNVFAAMRREFDQTS